MTFIDKNEYEAMHMVSNGPDILSLRDKMMLMILYNTGCRVSELINILTQDVVIAHEGTSSIRFMGKGRKERVTPHTFRHSAAMNLLQAGVDISTIAIWLGHEGIETTHRYMVADIELKRKAMEKLEETADISFNYQPSFSILSFLESL